MDCIEILYRKFDFLPLWPWYVKAKIFSMDTLVTLANVLWKKAAQCGNCMIFYHSDFTWNQIWGFLKYKIRLFYTFLGSVSWFFALFEGWNYQIIKIQSPFWLQKMAVLALLHSQKLISRKIWMIEKFFPHCELF